MADSETISSTENQVLLIPTLVSLIIEIVAGILVAWLVSFSFQAPLAFLVILAATATSGIFTAIKMGIDLGQAKSWIVIALVMFAAAVVAAVIYNTLSQPPTNSEQEIPIVEDGESVKLSPDEEQVLATHWAQVTATEEYKKLATQVVEQIQATELVSTLESLYLTNTAPTPSPGITATATPTLSSSNIEATSLAATAEWQHLETRVAETVVAQLTATQAALLLTPSPIPIPSTVVLQPCEVSSPPCQFTVKAQQSYTTIAFDKYDSYEYASLIIDYNRTVKGLRTPLQPGMKINIPAKDLDRRTLFPPCLDPTTAKPCYYLPETDVTFIDLSQRFYGDTSKAEDVKRHNEFFDDDIPQSMIDAGIVQQGTLLILPDFD